MIHFLLFLPLTYGTPDKPQTMLWLFRGHISGQLFLIPRHVSPSSTGKGIREGKCCHSSSGSALERRSVMGLW